MIRIAEAEDLRPIYHYQMQFSSPYFFPVGYDTWKTSFLEDVDGEGRTLFKELDVKAAWENDELIGFIQYGRTAFGFDPNGELSSDVSYCVIRNLYFQKDRTDAGHLCAGPRDPLNSRCQRHDSCRAAGFPPSL